MTETIKNWLLEEKNPAIRYRTLADLCGCTDEVVLTAAYNAIWEDKAVKRMLLKQGSDGSFESERRYYGNFTFLRYLTAFAEYGLARDPRIEPLIDHAVQELRASMAEDPAGCAIPLILRALVMLGCHEREDVMTLMETFAESIRFDGGWMCKRLLDKRADRKSCYKAALAGLYLYAESAKKGVSLPHKEKLLDYFLKRDVFYNSEKNVLLSGDGRFGWRFIDNFFPVEPMRMGLPLTVSALAILGAGDHPALAKAWAMLDAKRDEEGKFALDGTLTKQPCSFGAVGKPNKWITYYAELAYRYRIGI